VLRTDYSTHNQMNEKGVDFTTVCLTENCVLYKTSQPGPGAARDKFDELTSPIWTFYVTQRF